MWRDQEEPQVCDKRKKKEKKSPSRVIRLDLNLTSTHLENILNSRLVLTSIVV